MTPREIIGAICPALAQNESVSVFVQMAEENTNKKRFGKLYPYAVAYRACHLYTVTAGTGANSVFGMGQVASMSEGGQSVSFATRVESDANGGLETTKYGRMLLGLLKTCPTLGVNTAGLACLHLG
ncbi:MAG: DUF4054 domain-containing protein [Treponemataceae bacterium]|nr:DUF4054 domain-containing protein [Treponemataceae bacterium]